MRVTLALRGLRAAHIGGGFDEQSVAALPARGSLSMAACPASPLHRYQRISAKAPAIEASQRARPCRSFAA